MNGFQLLAKTKLRRHGAQGNVTIIVESLIDYTKESMTKLKDKTSGQVAELKRHEVQELVTAIVMFKSLINYTKESISKVKDKKSE